MKKLFIIPVLIFVSLIISCSSNSIEEEIIPTNTNKVTYAGSVKIIITNNCLNCHANPPTNGAPMSLSTYEALKEAVQNRNLIGRVEDGTMPSTGDKISAAQIQAIKDWESGGFIQ